MSYTIPEQYKFKVAAVYDKKNGEPKVSARGNRFFSVKDSTGLYWTCMNLSLLPAFRVGETVEVLGNCSTGADGRVSAFIQDVIRQERVIEEGGFNTGRETVREFKKESPTASEKPVSRAEFEALESRIVGLEYATGIRK